MVMGGWSLSVTCYGRRGVFKFESQNVIKVDAKMVVSNWHPRDHFPNLVFKNSKNLLIIPRVSVQICNSI
jgi:hypothetical protein